MLKWTITCAMMALALYGCDDGDDGGDGSDGGTAGAGGGSEGAACNMLNDDSTPQFTSVTKTEASDDLCPELTPEQLNSPDDGEGGDGGDDGDDCEPIIDAPNCRVTLDCPANGISGVLDVTNDGFTGILTVMVQEVTCEYEMAGTIQ